MPSPIKVLAFAGARDVLGRAEVDLEVDAGATAGDVLDLVCRRWPALEGYRRIIRLAVNGSYAEPSARVQAGDEVALIPPVAGG
jgi:molybdopterin converting factor subunit 1